MGPSSSTQQPQADLGDTAARVEIAKDVAAMQARGGYLVIGVDNNGRPTGVLAVPPVDTSTGDEAS